MIRRAPEAFWPSLSIRVWYGRGYELQLFSEAGRTYLPNIQQLFDDGVNIPPSRAAALIADIGAGRLIRLPDGCCALSMTENCSNGR